MSFPSYRIVLPALIFCIILELHTALAVRVLTVVSYYRSHYKASFSLSILVVAESDAHCTHFKIRVSPCGMIHMNASSHRAYMKVQHENVYLYTQNFRNAV